MSASKWRGRVMEVEVLYSHAGIATHLTVSAGGSWLLVDCGDGCLRDLLDRRRDRDKDRLAGVLISHGHYDHVGGLWSVLGILRCEGHTHNVKVVQPPGCEEATAIVDAYLRIHSATMHYAVDRIEPAPGEEVRLGPFAVVPFEVVHGGSIRGFESLPRMSAYGYSISVQGERIVYSGDTGETETLERAVESADLAIIEATYPEDSDDVHLGRRYAERIGATAKEALFIHTIHPALIGTDPAPTGPAPPATRRSRARRPR